MKIKNIKVVGMSVLVSLLALGCGSSPNDQGVSFTLVGFGELTVDETTGRGTCTDASISNLVSFPLSDIIEGSGVVVGCPIVQNNLTSATVRTERVNLSFFIPGASSQPPASSSAATIVLGSVPAVSNDATTPVPVTNENALESRAVIPVNLVPQSTRAWLSQNRGQLPSTPFSMDITVTITAITSAGDQLVSNRAIMQANVMSDLPINPDTSGEEIIDEEL